ncbi:hypothetical protein, partial [Klebsiella pneumoniae]
YFCFSVRGSLRYPADPAACLPLFRVSGGGLLGVILRCQGDMQKKFSTVSFFNNAARNVAKNRRFAVLTDETGRLVAYC